MEQETIYQNHGFPRDIVDQTENVQAPVGSAGLNIFPHAGKLILACPNENLKKQQTSLNIIDLPSSQLDQ